jgi:hypothetical protein
MLRKRLLRRGLACSAGLFALLLSKNTVAAAVPDSLLNGTVRAAVLFTQSTPAAASAVSSSASSLAEEVLEGLRLGAVKRRAAYFLALLVLALTGVAAAGVMYSAFHKVTCS